MSIEQNLRTAEEHLQAEAARQLERLLATLVDDCTYEDSLLSGRVQGKEAVRRYYLELWNAFPDFSFEVTNRVADERCVVYEMTFRGTHCGPFRGIPATGQSGELKSVVIFPMCDGKAEGERIYFDGLSFLVQAKLLPDPEGRFGRAFFGLLVLLSAVRRLAGRLLVRRR